ncbi:MAG TPA: hypothetical protein VK524_11740, partial [Polyangiaceae bacterium]|nr:hypothetical protein [Polyangiaceae bacterium]
MFAEERGELVAVLLFRRVERPRAIRSFFLWRLPTGIEGGIVAELQRLLHTQRQMFGFDPAIARKSDRRTEAFLELAHVERPVVKH